jgi:hypothetical protein
MAKKKTTGTERVREGSYGGKKGLNKAFAKLREAGYFAEQNFSCCQTCGWSEVPEDEKDKVVFYHNQDVDELKEDGCCYVSWMGDAAEITRIFNDNGVETVWNGQNGTRIMIRIKPRK